MYRVILHAPLLCREMKKAFDAALVVPLGAAEASPPAGFSVPCIPPDDSAAVYAALYIWLREP